MISKYAGMREELEKIALTRWQKEQAAGNMSARDTLRLPAGAASNKPDLIRAARDSMWSGGTDLSPEQLERHRALNGMLAETDVTRLGGIHSHTLHAGPQTTLSGQVSVGPDAGTWFRRYAEGHAEEDVRNQHRQIYSQLRQPEDRTIYRAVAAHEGGEKALARGANDREMPLRPIGTHAGALPIVAEQQAMYRDPTAQRVTEKFRNADPDNAFIAKKIRQYGGTPNNPLPIGGKAHVKLEEEVYKHTPETLPAAGLRSKVMTSTNPVTGAYNGYGAGLNVENKYPRFPAVMSGIDTGIKHLEGSGNSTLSSWGNNARGMWDQMARVSGAGSPDVPRGKMSKFLQTIPGMVRDRSKSFM
jgi:hypothetical protein